MILLVQWLDTSYLQEATQSSPCTNVTLPNLSTQHYAWQIWASIIYTINCNTTKSCTLVTAWWHTGVGHRYKPLLLWHRLIPRLCPSFFSSWHLWDFVLSHFSHHPLSQPNLTWDSLLLSLFSPSPTFQQIYLPFLRTFHKSALHSHSHSAESIHFLQPCWNIIGSHAWPASLLLITHFVSDFIYLPGFNNHSHVDDSQVYISSPDFSSKLQIQCLKWVSSFPKTYLQPWLVWLSG